MSSDQSSSRKGSVLTTIAVAIVCLIALDLFYWSRSDVDLGGANPVSFAKGETTERAFVVTEPGTPHVLQIDPYTKPKNSNLVVQDTRYAFKFSARVTDPAKQTIHEFADDVPNHRTRRMTFTPTTPGEHVIVFETSEGEQRATLVMHAGEGSAILRTVRGLIGEQ